MNEFNFLGFLNNIRQHLIFFIANQHLLYKKCATSGMLRVFDVEYRDIFHYIWKNISRYKHFMDKA